MERTTGYRKQCLRLITRAFVVATVVLTASPALAREQRSASARGDRGFYCVRIDQEGRAEKRSLDAVAARIQHESAAGPVQVLLMVHGFQTPESAADKDYEKIAGRMAKQTSRLGIRTMLVGLHWDSGSNSLGAWLPKAVGHRITSLLGFKKAIKNPYLEKVKEARQVGRNGLRTVLFRLQDAAPQAPIHVLAHSLGAEVVVAALAPEAALSDLNEPIQHRGRLLSLGVVTLMGADLDFDTFNREHPESAAHALSQAQVWWVTVPESKRADGMLELRRGAGRGDAIGNRGLKLSRQDTDRLLRRRGLVLDMGDVPVKHGFTDYCTPKRVEALARSLCYLADPAAPEGQSSTLAALDRLLRTDPARLRLAANADCSTRLYTVWRTGRETSDYPAVAVVERDERPVAESIRSGSDVVQVSR